MLLNSFSRSKVYIPSNILGVFRSLDPEDQDNEEQLQQIKNPVKHQYNKDEEDPVDDREYSTN